MEAQLIDRMSHGQTVLSRMVPDGWSRGSRGEICMTEIQFTSLYFRLLFSPEDAVPLNMIWEVGMGKDALRLKNGIQITGGDR